MIYNTVKSRLLTHSVVNSIPIDRKTKSYFQRKYAYLSEHNGPMFASEVFSTIRTAVMGYIADPDRVANLNTWISKCPVRKNGWLRRLFLLADSNPHRVLQFLKLYTTEPKPLVSVEEQAAKQAEILFTATAVEGAPSQMEIWARALTMHSWGIWKQILEKASECDFQTNFADSYICTTQQKKRKVIKRKSFDQPKTLTDAAYYYTFQAAKLNGIDRVVAYLRYWKNLLHKPLSIKDKDAEFYIRDSLPSPVVYRDTGKGQQLLGGTSIPGYSNEYGVGAPIPELFYQALSYYQHWKPGDPKGKNHAKMIEVLNQAMTVSHDRLGEDLMGLYSMNNMFDMSPILKWISVDDSTELELIDIPDWGNCEVAPGVWKNISEDRDVFIVGHIHHIPKKGTVKRRPIADINRYLQAGLAPCQKSIRRITQALPNNCQFDQDKLDKLIQKHVNSKELYAGSVDLSQATDWLPFSWFDSMNNYFGWFTDYDFEEEIPVSSDLALNSLDARIAQAKAMKQQQKKAKVKAKPQLSNWSYDLFKWCIDQYWENDSYISKWDRGQPLGTWPSFDILTVTHYLFCESTSFVLGNLSSPFAVLGDDIVFFDEKVRACYIRTMNKWNNPLSLHKSYEGRMVEFAGKIFIQNQPMGVYTPGLSMLHIHNLFDYQRCGMLDIPWENLPKKIRRKFAKLCTDAQKSDPAPVSAPTIYRLCQLMAAKDNKFLQMDSSMSESTQDLVAAAILYHYDMEERRKLRKQGKLLEQKMAFDRVPVVFQFGDSLVFYDCLCSRIRSNSRSMRTSKWYKRKVRPTETEELIRLGIDYLNNVRRA